MAILIDNMIEAYRWRQVAVRNLDWEEMQKVYSNRSFPFDQPDGQVYYPEFDDIENSIDKQSLFYSTQKAAAAADQFRYNSMQIIDKEKTALARLDIKIDTPLGLIVLLGTTDNSYTAENVFILIDFGGNDNFSGLAGATSSLLNPISVMIDFEGDDHYSNTLRNTISQGAGIFGTGLLLDLKGNDTYESKYYSQGMGVFGAGILCDVQGNDKYKLDFSGQGCGYFGIGMLLDSQGDDEYYIFGDGQGMGGVNGLGIIADYAGNDKYTAEWNPEVLDRGDYHSDKKVNENYVQGAGIGRRGDGSDGHCWAGGQGAIIDIYGDDVYSAGNFSQGIGYWFGLGVMYDKEGNDEFNSVYFTQAAGAHFAMGVIVDESGNDRHLLEKTGGAGLSFGWDWVNTLFVDKGGDDYYQAYKMSIANAQLRSNTYFIEVGGNDTYRVRSDKGFLGDATIHSSFNKPGRSETYFSEGSQIALFIEIGGIDDYLIWNKEVKVWEKAEKTGNNMEWSFQ
ncbi:MAG: hypothetical protein JW995_11050, partial [Melioribacteraceae bacterium]|nr:hypothetical protein [Melioribacteraceae bacterium]